MADEDNESVSQLIRRYALQSLQSYCGNLTSAIDVINNGWLPDRTDPKVQSLVATLREAMAESGEVEEDLFLLRIGLTVPGRQRGIIPPLLVLDENRGGFGPRRHREAAGQVKRLREALSLGRKFFPTLTDDTEQAVIELNSVATLAASDDDDVWFESYRDLSEDETSELSRVALGFIDDDEHTIHEIGTGILKDIVSFRRAPLGGSVLLELVSREIYWPSCLYRDAGNEIAELLRAEFERDLEQLPLNHLLLAFAWTRCSESVKLFRQWSERQPEWASKLHVSTGDYLPFAGWTLDNVGERRNTVNDVCYRLRLTPTESNETCGCRLASDDLCPSCGGRLGYLFDFTNLDIEKTRRFFVGEFNEAPRKILCCFHCACYEPTFARYDPDGNSEWLAPFDASEFERHGEWEECFRTPCNEPTSPFAASEPFSLQDSSTLGGMPSWLQDAEFPHCIECGKLMLFLAQHDNGPLGEEGIYYAFFCSTCHISSVSYQQT